MKDFRLHGLVAATHTPFDSEGRLNLDILPSQAAHLAKSGVKTVFIGGSTGESHSLTLEERLSLTEGWMKAGPDADLRVVVHVGSNCLSDSRTLASHAQRVGASACSALSPMYFKPGSLDLLIESCALIASGAPDLPFYYYDIPALTGVSFSMTEFLTRAPSSIPNLAGIKFTNMDPMTYLKCLQTGFDLPWGVDEAMLGALALGAKGAVGSSFNFAAPIYLRLIAAFESGDLESARLEQLKSVRLIDLLASHSYMAAAKAVMGMLGVDVGSPRLPNKRLDDSQISKLRCDLDTIGFFEWIR